MMSRIEYSWQVALQQSLLPLPRCAQLTRVMRLVLSAVHQPVLTWSGTVHGSSPSQYTLSSVLRSAGLLSLNLRGRGFTVPANGCLATLLLRWQREGSRTVLNQFRKSTWGNSFHQVKGNLRFPLTITYHGCPHSGICMVLASGELLKNGCRFTTPGKVPVLSD